MGRLTEQTYFLATVTGFSLKKYPPAEVSHLKRADTATDAANDGRLCFSSQTERNRRKETNEVAQKPKDPWSTTDTLSAKVRAVLFSPHTSECYHRRKYNPNHSLKRNLMHDWLISCLMTSNIMRKPSFLIISTYSIHRMSKISFKLTNWLTVGERNRTFPDASSATASANRVKRRTKVGVIFAVHFRYIKVSVLTAN